MKKIIFLMIFLCAFSGNASGSQIYDYKVSKLWAAYIFTDQNGLPMVRMSTSYINKLTLCIDFSTENTYLLSLYEPVRNFIPESAIAIDIRIDDNKIIKAPSKFNTYNGFLWLTVFLPKNTDFIQQAILGNTLRLKINSLNPVYFRFSLIGFTAAFNHAMNLCKRVYKNYNNNDEEFFREYSQGESVSIIQKNRLTYRVPTQPVRSYLHQPYNIKYLNHYP